jgi:hypothetical protein
MPVDKPVLDALARAYVAPMTSIRGRRVHRLLLREFARFDLVVAAAAEDGSPALLALAEDGRMAVCATDGRGAAAQVVELGRAAAAVVTTAYDLLKDSLPPVSWTIAAPAAATVTIRAADIAPADRERLAALLRARRP